jgi:hypothetical protein
LGHAPGPRQRSRGLSDLVVRCGPYRVGRTESADYAELLQVVALLLRTDYINNSGASVGSGSGPPKTDVVQRWPRGGPGLGRALGWRELFLVFRSDGVVVPTWSVRTEGSERGRLCVALVYRPLAFGPAIRVVDVGLGRVGLFAAVMRRPTGPPRSITTVRERVGLFADGICRQTGPPRARSRALGTRVGLNVNETSKTPPTAGPERFWRCGLDAGRFERHTDVETAPDRSALVVRGVSPLTYEG